MDELFMLAALEEARQSLDEGGIPSGAVLVLDGQLVARGRNRQVQKDSNIRHAIIECLDQLEPLSAEQRQTAVLYTTLSPCDMCSGAILHYRIPHVVVGDNQSYRGPDQYLEVRGVRYQVQTNDSCRKLMQRFTEQEPELWRGYLGLV